MSRLRCPEIRRLPKSTKVTSIQWRNQTPGALDPLLLSGWRNRADNVIDPLHPGANLKKGPFPAVQRNELGIKMIPTGLLLREEKQFPVVPILTWRERVQKAKEAGITGNRHSNIPNIENSGFRPGEQLYPDRDYNNTFISSRNSTPSAPILDLKLKKIERRVPMSFHISTSKARMGQQRHQRKRLEKRLRTAINLVVAKGAFRDNEKNKIGINMDDSGRKWVVQGWAYMFFPTLEINQMPYATLVNLLRLLLNNMNSKAIQMENEWLNKSLLEDDTYRKSPSLDLKKRRITEAPLPTKPFDGSQIVTKDTHSILETRSLSIPKVVDHTHSRKRKYKRTNTENVPSKSLAGKPPAVWRRELISGLTLLGGPHPPTRKQSFEA